MFTRKLIYLLFIGIVFCGILGVPGFGLAADVTVQDTLSVGTLLFADGTSQTAASGATKVWSGVVDTLNPPIGIGGSGAYLYTASRSGTGNVTMFFNYLVQVCVVSAQVADSSCFVYNQSGNSITVHCTKHSDNTLVDSIFAFICLAP